MKSVCFPSNMIHRMKLPHITIKNALQKASFSFLFVPASAHIHSLTPARSNDHLGPIKWKIILRKDPSEGDEDEMESAITRALFIFFPFCKKNTFWSSPLSTQRLSFASLSLSLVLPECLTLFVSYESFTRQQQQPDLFCMLQNVHGRNKGAEKRPGRVNYN